MNVASIFGQLLLWAGFLSGALATVFKPEIESDPWSTINWVWYGVSAVVCLAGVVAIRISKRQSGLESEQGDATFSSLPGLATSLVANVAELRKSQDSLKPSEIVGLIESKLHDDLRDFADAREAIASQRGLQMFADVMTEFAAGERAVNRSWSAAADGYVDEVAMCLEKAEQFFRNVESLLAQQA